MAYFYKKNLFDNFKTVPNKYKSINKLIGTINKIIFYNKSTHFCILNIELEPTVSLVAKGKIINPNIGQIISIEGNWTQDKKFGDQFDFYEYKQIEPKSCDAIIRFLGSGLIKNIGEKTAKIIVDYFKEKTLYIIENNPKRLNEVPGIGKVKAEYIVKGFQANETIKKIMLFLAEHNIATRFSYKLYTIYGKETIDVLKKNPYRLIKDVKGIGFNKADKIALKIGILENSDLRILNGLYYILDNNIINGHSYLPYEELKQKIIELLELKEHNELDRILMDEELLKLNDIIIEKNKYFLSWIYFSEVGIAEKIKLLLSMKPIVINSERINKIIKQIEKENHIELSETQNEILNSCYNHNFFIITGGPGTGKTTITKFISKAFKEYGLKICLCSPTGRAAKILSEVTSFPAFTIHKLLEFSYGTGFQRNENNKLNYDVFIIDEFSMVDLTLFYNFLKAVPLNSRIILIGDKNQLPSIGAGNLLSDFISSQKIKVYNLNKIYRQAQKSLIVKNSHNIINKKNIIFNNGKTSDFFFFEENNPEKINETVLGLISKRLPGYGIKSKNIQILIPMYKGVNGVNNVNLLVQDKINKSGTFFEYNNIQYKPGDKVIQLKNNYEKQVMNGDIGHILSIGENKNDLISNSIENESIRYYLEQTNIDVLPGIIIVIKFLDNLVTYSQADLEEISLAYAITIHKSQGSEFEAVIIPITMSYYVMLDKTLIYTAITRSKKLCVLVGEKKAFDYAIKNMKKIKRYSSVLERLTDV